MKINLDKVICIDLMKYNNQTIHEFADYFGLNGDALCDNRRDGIKKYYISTEITDLDSDFYGGHNVVAIEFTPNPKVNTGGHVTKHNLKLNLPFTTREIKKLRQIEPFDFIAFRKKKNIEAAELRRLNKNENTPSEKPNCSITEKPGKQSRSKTSRKVNKPVKLNLDAILDKISKFGLDSLSTPERNFLDRFSRS